MSEMPNTSDAWTRYWASGMKESCFSGQSAVSFPEVWRDFAVSMSPKAHILDLACGAGTVLRQLQTANPALVLVGADFANTLPSIPQVTLHPRTDITSLPFDQGSFDGVVSQFGFEYADQNGAAREAARVLRPGGALCLILHNADGPAIADARQRITRLSISRSPEGLLSKLAALSKARANSEETNKPAAEAGAAWHALRAKPTQDETTSWLLSFSGDLLKNWPRFEPAYLTDNVAKLTGEIALYAARIESMTDAALDEAGVTALADLFRTVGVDVTTVEPIAYKSDKVAWHLSGTKH